jgi:Tol biopolymer transport system component
MDPHEQSLWMRQVATSSNVQIVPPAAVRYDGVAFSRDGNFVYYSIYPNTGSFATLYSVPVLGGSPQKVTEDVDSSISFSPDGQRFVVVRGNNRQGETYLLIVRADGTLEKTLVTTKLPQTFGLLNPSWSPDGKTVAAPQFEVQNGVRMMRVAAVDVQTGAIQAVGSKRWQSVGSVAWTPDGHSIVFTAKDADLSQIWRLSFPGGQAQKITNDLNDYSEVSVSADGRSMVVTQGQQNAHIWVIPTGADATKAQEITSGVDKSDGSAGITWTPDGKIIYRSNVSGSGDFWICDSDGQNAHVLPTGGDGNSNPHVSSDGRYLVFDSSRGASSRVWRANIDGGNAQPISPGPSDTRSIVTKDGYVIYSSVASSPFTLWKVPIEGGSPVQIPSSDPTVTAADISPDGQQLAVSFNSAAQRGWRIGLRPVASDVAPTATQIAIGLVHWTPDGKGLTFIDADTDQNLWNLPPLNGPAKRLTNFTSQFIFNFAWSADGKRIALSRGIVTTDVVLVTQK